MFVDSKIVTRNTTVHSLTNSSTAHKTPDLRIKTFGLGKGEPPYQSGHFCDLFIIIIINLSVTWDLKTLLRQIHCSISS